MGERKEAVLSGNLQKISSFSDECAVMFGD